MSSKSQLDSAERIVRLAETHALVPLAKTVVLAKLSEPAASFAFVPRFTWEPTVKQVSLGYKIDLGHQLFISLLHLSLDQPIHAPTSNATTEAAVRCRRAE